jgi:hypothetical protein
MYVMDGDFTVGKQSNIIAQGKAARRIIYSEYKLLQYPPSMEACRCQVTKVFCPLFKRDTPKLLRGRRCPPLVFRFVALCREENGQTQQSDVGQIVCS